MAEAYRAKATAGGAVGSLEVFVDEGSSATGLVAGLYEDEGGHPGALLDAGGVAPAQGWNAVALDARLVKGRRYWIGVLGSGGALKVRNDGGGGRRETSRRAA